MRKSTAIPVILTILLVITVCCLCVCLVLFASGATYYFWQDNIQSTLTADNFWQDNIQSTLTADTQTPAIEEDLPANEENPITTEEPGISLDPDPTLQPANPSTQISAYDNLLALQEEIVPINDAIVLAERLAGKSDIPYWPYRRRLFPLTMQLSWLNANVDTNENFRISATLRYLGENVYIWIENGVDYDQRDLTALGDAFDDEIYPTDREFFGSEWSPGVDDDPHIYIVYAGGLGLSLAGYYSS